MSISAVPIEAVNIYNKALAFYTKGDFITALNEYKRALELFPNFIEAYNNMGEIYSRTGRYDLAISTYKKALGIDRNPRVLLNVGVEYYNRTDYNTALVYFKESIVKKPDFLEGNFYTGMASFNLKDEKAAERYFKNVVETDKKHLKTNYLLSYIYFDWKQYEKTLWHLNNIRDIADDKVFLNKYFGFCYYHLGRYNEAIDHLNLAIESNPKYDQFRDYLKTLTYENKMKELGNIDARIKEMEDAMVDTTPGIREVTRLSILYTYKGDFTKAENILAPYSKGI